MEKINGADGFDPAAPPPFKIGDIRAAIPKHCWVKNPWKSMGYVVRDVVVVFGLVAVAAYFNHFVVWPFYWFAQGTMFWALFVLGHDCGHGSFSDNPRLNSVVGHLLHSSVLVPYNGWRISHRIHHQNHGHVDKDESWHPVTEKIYRAMEGLRKKIRFTLPFALLLFPFYLWKRSPGRYGSHFNPNSELFAPNERKDIITSAACCSAMVALLVGLSFSVGPIHVLKLYGVPYVEWSYIRGSLTTLDRDYGLFNNILHDIGTHVVHHLFPRIPHYHLVEATEAVKPILGKYYREPMKSGLLPLHLWGYLVRSFEEDHYVSDTGDIVYYQTDKDL